MRGERARDLPSTAVSKRAPRKPSDGPRNVARERRRNVTMTCLLGLSFFGGRRSRRALPRTLDATPARLTHRNHGRRYPLHVPRRRQERVRRQARLPRVRAEPRSFPDRPSPRALFHCSSRDAAFGVGERRDRADRSSESIDIHIRAEPIRAERRAMIALARVSAFRRTMRATRGRRDARLSIPSRIDRQTFAPD